MILFLFSNCKTEYIYEEYISIKKLPQKIEYYIGDEIDYTGLIVTKINEDGSVTEINDYVIEPENQTVLEESGVKTISISYSTHKLEFDIDVKEIKVEELSITSLPKKNKYFVGEEINYEGLEIKSLFNNATSSTIEDYTIEPAENTKLEEVGQKKVVVNYKNKNIEFYIDVCEYKCDISVYQDFPDYKINESFADYYEKISPMKIYASSEKSGFISFNWYMYETSISEKKLLFSEKFDCSANTILNSEYKPITTEYDRVIYYCEIEFKNDFITILKKSDEVELVTMPAIRYLAIGNSITIHGKCDYWWNECGMAATKAEKDYFHIVSDYLNVNSKAINFSVWEIQDYDRQETFEQIEQLLTPNLNYITIQLSENATDLSTFSRDLNELINFIKNKSPYAKIVIVDDFWSIEKHNLKLELSQKNNISFADLSEIIGDSDYFCGLGTVVYDENNVEHIVMHSGVATHPGDKGMNYIATKIVEQFELLSTD